MNHNTLMKKPLTTVIRIANGTYADYAVFIRQGHLADFRELEELRMTEGISVADKYRQIYGAGGEYHE